MKTYILEYQQLTKDSEAYKWVLDRMNVISTGINNLQNAYVHIQKKINIWIMDDPEFKVSDHLLTSSILNYTPRWPMIVNAFSAVFCLGASAWFHLFQIHSKKMNSILSRLDYGGISFLIMGSSYPPIFYIFACEPVYTTRNWFLGLITTTSSLAFFVTMLPSMSAPKFRPFRGFMFIILGLSAAIPFVYT